MPSQITTVCLFKYKGFSRKFWGLKMLQTGHEYVREIEGLEFYKFMGSGKGMGFHPLPDWSVYALVQVWSSEAMARQFFRDSALIREADQRVQERGVFFLKNLQANGDWSGTCPFRPHAEPDPANPYLAVITRATIKNERLLTFWANVPAAQRPLKRAPGLLYAKGIGEIPIKQMATFSIWEDQKAMQQFAYQQRGHQRAIRRTRTLDWYSEELFSRFQPYAFSGTWDGKNWDFSPKT